MTAEPQRFGEYLEMFVDLQIEIHGYTSRCSTVSAISSPA